MAKAEDPPRDVADVLERLMQVVVAQARSDPNFAARVGDALGLADPPDPEIAETDARRAAFEAMTRAALVDLAKARISEAGLSRLAKDDLIARLLDLPPEPKRRRTFDY